MKCVSFSLLLALPLALQALPSTELPAPSAQPSVTEPAPALPVQWWSLFQDPELNALEGRLLESNQNLKAGLARLESSRALLGLSRSAFLPSLGADASVSRSRYSRAVDNAVPVEETSTHQLGLGASWELDIFGRVRQLNEAARADLKASAELLEDLRLSLSAELAANYLALRALDRERGIVHNAVLLREETKRLVAVRVHAGSATDFDSARAEADYATAQAEEFALAERRSSLQNAIAVLVGATAADFRIAERLHGETEPVQIPSGLSSELLQRRPDLRAAEAQLQSATAAIGVAKASFYPRFLLTGSAGYASRELDQLGNSNSTLWSLAPSVHLPLFEGGANRARLARSRAAFDEQLALYHQRVLVALREVQEALDTRSWLAQETEAQARAVAAARRAADIAGLRYKAGNIGYLEFIDAQRSVLAAERVASQLDSRRLQSEVALIRSLGGGWSGPSAKL